MASRERSLWRLVARIGRLVPRHDGQGEQIAVVVVIVIAVIRRRMERRRCVTTSELSILIVVPATRYDSGRYAAGTANLDAAHDMVIGARMR